MVGDAGELAIDVGDFEGVEVLLEVSIEGQGFIAISYDLADNDACAQGFGILFCKMPRALGEEVGHVIAINGAKNSVATWWTSAGGFVEIGLQGAGSEQ